MSAPRFTRVILPLNRAGCEPSQPCAVASTCARHRAALQSNHVVRDFFQRTDIRAGTAMCDGFMGLNHPMLLGVKR